MPQQSIQYALGRIGVLKRSAITKAQLDRLMAAHRYDEAVRTLSDIGYVTQEGADFQSAADAQVLKACTLLREITPEPELTDCFLYRYDIHNIKVLLKSRFLAQQPEYLSQCGTLPVEQLKHAVIDRTYHVLPTILRETVEALEKKLAAKFDPMLIDAELDKAMYRMIFLQLEKSHVAVCKQYFTAKVDLQNVIMLLRVKAMGKNEAFYREIMLPGGQIAAKELAKGFDDPEKLSKLVKPYGAQVEAAVKQAVQKAGQLPLLEKAADDYYFGLFSPYKYANDTIEPMIAYLLQKQREATDIRLIMAGKLNGFEPEAVAERVRELNG